MENASNNAVGVPIYKYVTYVYIGKNILTCHENC